MSWLAKIARGLALIALLTAAPVVTASAADAPLMRVETGSHQGFINRAILLDAERLLTISDDQTSRVWGLADGRPQVVIQGVAGPRDQGAIYAAAVSDRYVALAGRAGIDTGGAFVRLLDKASLSPAGLLSGLPDVVTALAFSPDGRTLAVGFGEQGLRVYTLGRGAPILVLGAVAGTVSDLAFLDAATLAAVDADGGVRLIPLAGAAPRSVALSAGFSPWRLAVSPDGRRLAVVSRARNRLALIDPKTGRALEREVAGVESLAAVAWGQGDLILGGRDHAGGRVLRLSPDTGREAASVATGTAAVTAVASSAAGPVYADADGDWGAITGGGPPQIRSRPVKLSFRAMSAAPLAVSRDGRRVAVSHEGRAFAVVDIGRRSATAWTATGATDLVVRRAPTTPVRIADLEPGERTLDTALGSDGAALVGSNFYLRALDARGGTRWKTPTEAPVWGVAVSGDGRLAVAALGNGLLMWCDMTTGAVRLTAFVAPNLEWAAWTPDGFFDRSAEGGRLVGYLINRGPRPGADFLRLDQTAASYRRSDLVQAALRGAKGDDALVANATRTLGRASERVSGATPPVVTVESVCGYSDVFERITACFSGKDLDNGALAWSRLVAERRIDVTLKVVERAGGGLGTTLLRVNGVRREPDAPQSRRAEDAELRRFQIELPAGDVDLRFSVGARDPALRSEDAKLTIRGVHPAGARVTAPAVRVLAIGISRYQMADFNLEPGIATRDAESIAAFFRGGKDATFSTRTASVLTDQSATGAQIRAALETFVSTVGPEDVAIIFFAGHGGQVSGDYIFAPYDLGGSAKSKAQIDEVKRGKGFADLLVPSLFQNDGLTQAEFVGYLSRLRAGRAIVFLDTCFGGSFAAFNPAQQQSMATALTERLSENAGRHVVASARGFALDAEAQSGAAPSHSVFTGAVLKALGGEADVNRDRTVTLVEVADYVRAELPRAAKAQGAEQEPIIDYSGDPYITLVRLN